MDVTPIPATNESAVSVSWNTSAMVSRLVGQQQQNSNRPAVAPRRVSFDPVALRTAMLKRFHQSTIESARNQGKSIPNRDSLSLHHSRRGANRSKSESSTDHASPTELVSSFAAQCRANGLPESEIAAHMSFLMGAIQQTMAACSDVHAMREQERADQYDALLERSAAASVAGGRSSVLQTSTTSHGVPHQHGPWAGQQSIGSSLMMASLDESADKVVAAPSRRVPAAVQCDLAATQIEARIQSPTRSSANKQKPSAVRDRQVEEKRMGSPMRLGSPSAATRVGQAGQVGESMMAYHQHSTITSTNNSRSKRSASVGKPARPNRAAELRAAKGKDKRAALQPRMEPAPVDFATSDGSSNVAAPPLRTLAVSPRETDIARFEKSHVDPVDGEVSAVASGQHERSGVAGAGDVARKPQLRSPRGVQAHKDRMAAAARRRLLSQPAPPPPAQLAKNSVDSAAASKEDGRQATSGRSRSKLATRRLVLHPPQAAQESPGMPPPAARAMPKATSPQPLPAAERRAMSSPKKLLPPSQIFGRLGTPERGGGRDESTEDIPHRATSLLPSLEPPVPPASATKADGRDAIPQPPAHSPPSANTLFHHATASPQPPPPQNSPPHYALGGSASPRATTIDTDAGDELDIVELGAEGEAGPFEPKQPPSSRSPSTGTSHPPTTVDVSLAGILGGGGAPTARSRSSSPQNAVHHHHHAVSSPTGGDHSLVVSPVSTNASPSATLPSAVMASPVPFVLASASPVSQRGSARVTTSGPAQVNTSLAAITASNRPEGRLLSPDAEKARRSAALAGNGPFQIPATVTTPVRPSAFDRRDNTSFSHSQAPQGGDGSAVKASSFIDSANAALDASRRFLHRSQLRQAEAEHATAAAASAGSLELWSKKGRRLLL